MTSGPFNDPQLDSAWHAYAERDRRLVPRAELQGRILARCQDVSVPDYQGAKVRRSPSVTVMIGLGLAASMAALTFVLWPRREPPNVPAALEAHAMGVTGLAGPVAANRPRLVGAPRPLADTTALLDAYVQHVELPAVLMMFDAAPMLDREPLQMVRVRLPRETLQALGLVLLEPDADGVVDVDVLIGEDGLPRDIRKVRIGQEHK